jgi:type III secretion protein J
MKRTILFSLMILGLLLTGCERPQALVNQVSEREANEIIVYLASKGISATKMEASSGGVGGGDANMWNITVSAGRNVEAMALLNQVGLPRIKGTSLLDLFSASGMMQSDREETIRYQAGVAEELQNMIRMMDGVLDADVQIAFPTPDVTALPGATPQRVTASVFVKHQGVFDDPNNYLEMKIRRLLAGSVTDLNYDDVTVVSDRSRITDISLTPSGGVISTGSGMEGSVSIWSVQMDKGSTTRFRVIFFTFIVIILAFAALVGLLIYRFYPVMQKMRAKKEEPKSEEES